MVFSFKELLTLQYQDINLLAFVCVYKRHYKNSIIHNPNGLIINKMAKELGCTSKKIKKYLVLLEAKNLLIKRGLSYQIVSLGKCINVLINKEKQGYYVRFFTHLKSKEFILPITAKCKEYKSLIEQELAKLNFNNQLHQQYVAGHNTKHCIKRDIASQGQPKSYFGAKTGTYHLSSVIGCSAATAKRRLRKWNEDKLIVRRILQEDTNNLIIENLCANLKKYRAVVRNAKTIFIGSEITNFSKLGCSIQKECRKSKEAFDLIRLMQVTNNNTNTMWAMY